MHLQDLVWWTNDELNVLIQVVKHLKKLKAQTCHRILEQ